MADQNITALPVSTTPASSDQLLLVGATEEKLIDYDKLANAILQKLTSKQYTLDQGTKTLPAALNELNSKDTTYLEAPANTDDFTIDMFTFNCAIRGNIVTLSPNVRGTVKTQKKFFTLCKIPSKYIPDRNLFDSYITQDGNVMIFSVLKTGEVQVYSNSVIDKTNFFLRKTISYVK